MRTLIVALIGVVTVILMLGCTVPPPPGGAVKIRYRGPEVPSTRPLSSFGSHTTQPASASGMDCYFLSVTGLGISDNLTSADFASRVTPDCLGLGQTSPLVSYGTITQSGVTMTVAAGKNRALTYYGISNSGVTSCEGMTLSALFSAGIPSIYPLGSTAADLSADAPPIMISDSYDVSFSSGAPAADLVQKCLVPSAPQTLFAGAAYLGVATTSGSTSPFTTLVGTTSEDCFGSLGMPPPYSDCGSVLMATAPLPGGTYLYSSPETSFERAVRVDLYVPFPPSLVTYSTGTLNITAQAGQTPFISGSCPTSTLQVQNGPTGQPAVVALTGNLGYQVQLYTESETSLVYTRTPVFETNSVPTPIVATADSAGNYDVTQSLANGALPVSLATQVQGKFFHIVLIANENEIGSSTCSVMNIESASITLNP